MKNIKYNLIQRTNVGSPDDPIWEESKGHAVEIQCTDKNFDANYALALAEAWQGQVEVIPGPPDPDPEPPASDNPTWDELAAAIKEGVDSV